MCVLLLLPLSLSVCVCFHFRFHWFLSSARKYATHFATALLSLNSSHSLWQIKEFNQAQQLPLITLHFTFLAHTITHVTHTLTHPLMFSLSRNRVFRIVPQATTLSCHELSGRTALAAKTKLKLGCLPHVASDPKRAVNSSSSSSSSGFGCGSRNTGYKYWLQSVCCRWRRRRLFSPSVAVTVHVTLLLPLLQWPALFPLPPTLFRTHFSKVFVYIVCIFSSLVNAKRAWRL